MVTINSADHTNLTIKRRFRFFLENKINGSESAQLDFSEMSRNKTSLPLRTSQRSVGLFLLIKPAPAFIEHLQSREDQGVGGGLARGVRI